MKKFYTTLLFISILSIQTASALPWCHRGSVIEIADITWSQAQILANFSGTIPPGIIDIGRYKAFHAMNNFSAIFSGAGGNFPGGYNVPGAGEVIGVVYDPYSYTTVPTPGAYSITQGLKFKLNKCYAILPWIHKFESSFSASDNNINILDKKFNSEEKLRRN